MDMITIVKRTAVPCAAAVIAAVLGAACLPKQDQAAYSTHILLNNDTTGLPVEVLDRFDVIEVGGAGFPGLPPELLPKTILYIDIWAWERASSAEYQEAFGFWQPGPADLGMKSAVLEWTPGRAVHCYDWTDGAQPERFAAWVRAAMAKGVLGVFCDDWGADRFWWAGADSTKASVWPGYPNNAWIWKEVQRAEAHALRQVWLVHKEQGLTVFNGPAPRLSASCCFHENVGYGKETWDRLTSPGVDSWRYIFDGRVHMLQVNGLDRYGELTAAGLANLERAVAAAGQAPGKISIGLAYGTTPVRGGSIYQLPVDATGKPTRWADPRNWPGYVKGQP